MAGEVKVVDLNVADAEALLQALSEALKTTVSENGEPGSERARLFIPTETAVKFAERIAHGFLAANTTGSRGAIFNSLSDLTNSAVETPSDSNGSDT